MKAITINKAVIDRLTKTIKNIGRDFDAILSRDILQLYKNAQAKRFKSQNQTEGDPWPQLNPTYARWKARYAKTHPGTFMGGGRAMGIATGRLYKAATMQNLNDTQAITRGRTLFINISVPYAGYFNEVRNISSFGPQTRQAFKDRIAKFIVMQVRKDK
jgi:hypothetical protein